MSKLFMVAYLALAKLAAADPRSSTFLMILPLWPHRRTFSWTGPKLLHVWGILHDVSQSPITIRNVPIIKALLMASSVHSQGIILFNSYRHHAVGTTITSGLRIKKPRPRGVSDLPITTELVRDVAGNHSGLLDTSMCASLYCMSSRKH